MFGHGNSNIVSSPDIKNRIRYRYIYYSHDMLDIEVKILREPRFEICDSVVNKT
jgi:hypothetical protein